MLTMLGRHRRAGKAELRISGLKRVRFCLTDGNGCVMLAKKVKYASGTGKGASEPTVAVEPA